jgi:riboflavin kinase/FMN adenylyltransferase
VTIGTFDGVHLGHRALLEATVRRAADLDAASVAVTWDRHPAATLRPERVPPLLTSAERRAELIGESGIDALAILPFDHELASWPPERFAGEVLATRLRARAVLVGEGWRFGHGAVGDVALLASLGEELGFAVEGLTLTAAAGGPVSSSRIRAAVTAGDMALARTLLGRPFEVEGAVMRGDQRGRELGYPTANVRLDAALAAPPRGVYVAETTWAGRSLRAAVNVGVNPQFGGSSTDPIRVEVHLLDFEGDLYGRTLRVGFLHRLRDELTFPSVDELLAQMALDVRAAARATW